MPLPTVSQLLLSIILLWHHENNWTESNPIEILVSSKHSALPFFLGLQDHCFLWGCFLFFFIDPTCWQFSSGSVLDCEKMAMFWRMAGLSTASPVTPLIPCLILLFYCFISIWMFGLLSLVFINWNCIGCFFFFFGKEFDYWKWVWFFVEFRVTYVYLLCCSNHKLEFWIVFEEIW